MNSRFYGFNHNRNNAMKIEQILIYEQDNYYAFYPFCILHPSWELRVGALRIFEKYQKLFPEAKIIYHSNREKHTQFFLEKFNLTNSELTKANTLIVPANFIPSHSQLEKMNRLYAEHKIEKGDSSFIFRTDNQPIALYLKAEDIINPSTADTLFLRRMLNDFAEMFAGAELSESMFINFIWDAIYTNERALVEDEYLFSAYKRFTGDDYQGVNAYNESKIYLGENVKIEPNVFLNAEAGPIIIDDYSRIMANSVIVGPCYIGRRSTIKIGSKIYEKTSIGEHCKIGGEVENSIIQAYSNKQHEGFLGHSFLSEWVNLGANTNNSDLKNTYNNIILQIEDYKVETGKMFLGLLCGDHTKTAINSSFSTGTVAGVCSSIVCDGFPPKFIKSFSFGGETNSPIYGLEKSIAVARTVMARRNKELSDTEIELFKKEFEHSKCFF